MKNYQNFFVYTNIKTDAREKSPNRPKKVKTHTLLQKFYNISLVNSRAVRFLNFIQNLLWFCTFCPGKLPTKFYSLLGPTSNILYPEFKVTFTA